MTERVLVTGASGFVGRRLVRMLAERGTEVVAAVRRTSRTSGLGRRGVRLAEVDLAAGRGLEALDLPRFAAVFHLAALTAAHRPARFYRVNTGGTGYLLAALGDQAAAPRLVHCSSLAAADGGPVSHYGRSKLAAERLVRTSGVPAAIVRPPVVHGPGDACFIPALLSMAAAPVAVLPSGGGARYSLLHVDDLCRLLIAVADTGRAAPGEAAGLYEPGDGRAYTGRSLVDSVCRALGRPRRRVLAAAPWAVAAAAAGSELAAAARGRVAVFNRDKARELRRSWICTETPDQAELGWRPFLDFDSGLADFLADGGADGGRAAVRPSAQDAPAGGRHPALAPAPVPARKPIR